MPDRIEDRVPFEDAVKPLMILRKQGESPFSLFVATPVHSDVTLHYVQSLLELSRLCSLK